MKCKAGDMVRIRSKEWIAAQKRDEHGNILLACGTCKIIMEMEKYAGKEAKIIKSYSDATGVWYKLDIGNRCYVWQDWMFDPDYKADDPLPAEDAIRAMMDGEILMDSEGREFFWNKDKGCFVACSACYTSPGGIEVIPWAISLYRRLPKRKRPMTRFEVLNWVISEASHGWVVRKSDKEEWYAPYFHVYPKEGIPALQRARLLPDCSGVDEDTIQGFEVEE
jgi:hypothetical protein